MIKSIDKMRLESLNNNPKFSTVNKGEMFSKVGGTLYLTGKDCGHCWVSKSNMKLFLKIIMICIASIVVQCQCLYAQEKSYKDYYQNINTADSIYFLEKNYIKGLELYKKTLSEFDFVWVDDCMKFTQLALFNQRKDLALFFIKRAIDNGFELELIKYFNLGCLCNLNLYAKEVKLSNPNLKLFLEQNKNELQQYYNKIRPQYLKTIKMNILKRVIYDHVTDEFWKNSNEDIDEGLTTLQRDKIRKKRHANLCSKNTKYIERLFSKSIWIGERNLGRNTNQLMIDLNIEDSSINAIIQLYTSKYYLTGNRPIPHVSEDEYFYSTPYFITLHHGGLEAVQLLTTYKDTLINGGYLHPREFAYLSSLHDKNLEKQLLLSPNNYVAVPTPTIYDNKIRAAYLLPSFELDKAKHEYAHKHGIKLFYGFFNCSR